MIDVAEIRGPARATRDAAPVARETATVAVDPVRPEAPSPSPTRETAKPSPPSPPPVTAKSSGGRGFLGVLLGGVAAAGLGFILAQYVAPEGWPRPSAPDPGFVDRVTALETGFGEISARLDAVDERLDAIDAELSAPAVSADVVSRLEGEIEVIRSDVASLGETLAALPAGGTTPAPELPDFTGAFNEQMSQFEAEIERVTSAAEAEVAAARAEAEATRAAAETAARQATLRAALAEVEVALDTGAPLADALGGLEGLEVPPALSSVAADGVPPLAELQRRYPDAARSALQAAARGPAEGAGPVDRLTSFLMAQTNARSLQPREGDDADAVLSRAEAALLSGDLAGALTELSALGEAPRAAMGEWLAEAEARAAAEAAVADLARDIDAM